MAGVGEKRQRLSTGKTFGIVSIVSPCVDDFGTFCYTMTVLDLLEQLYYKSDNVIEHVTSC